MYWDRIETKRGLKLPKLSNFPRCTRQEDIKEDPRSFLIKKEKVFSQERVLICTAAFAFRLFDLLDLDFLFFFLEFLGVS